MDILIGAVVTIGAAVIAKLIYDGVKEGKSSGQTSNNKTSNNNNGNGKVTALETQQMIRDGRCAAHEHIASGVTESVVLCKQLLGLHSETGVKIDRLQQTIDKGFSETFTRLREAEGLSLIHI